MRRQGRNDRKYSKSCISSFITSFGKRAAASYPKVFGTGDLTKLADAAARLRRPTVGTTVPEAGWSALGEALGRQIEHPWAGTWIFGQTQANSRMLAPKLLTRAVITYSARHNPASPTADRICHYQDASCSEIGTTQ